MIILLSGPLCVAADVTIRSKATSLSNSIVSLSTFLNYASRFSIVTDILDIKRGKVLSLIYLALIKWVRGMMDNEYGWIVCM